MKLTTGLQSNFEHVRFGEADLRRNVSRLSEARSTFMGLVLEISTSHRADGKSGPGMRVRRTCAKNGHGQRRGSPIRRNLGSWLPTMDSNHD